MLVILLSRFRRDLDPGHASRPLSSASGVSANPLTFVLLLMPYAGNPYFEIWLLAHAFGPRSTRQVDYFF